MGHLRRPRAGAPRLGRGRPLTAPAAAGPLVRLLGDKLGDATSELWTDEDTVEVRVPGERIVDTLRTLRDDPDFGFFLLADAAAVDYGVGERFEVVYHLYSDKHPTWLRVRVPVDR
ncbi:MAG TPA: NADH-quinone oxidoreductase subunit C, partial [Candidatus Limnocylindria bacterium]|nr:NADH-quinone oxidoreductase subunit C [Candidatus Limnocylindria bacterium]